MKLFKKDALGNPFWVKRTLFFILGGLTLYRFKNLYNTKINGIQNLENIPVRNVLFVSNHQTYFADVALMLLVFFSVKNKYKKIGPLWILFNPKLRIYFIAAYETMKAGFLPKVMARAGAILVKRTWREKGKDISRDVDMKDQNMVRDALNDGWVITFPQGTTKPYAKGRKGTGFIIKENKPIVVPIMIDGMRRGFDKRGLVKKKKGVDISLTIKPAMNINYEDDPEDILNQVMQAIEQSEEFYPPNLKEMQDSVQDSDGPLLYD